MRLVHDIAVTRKKLPTLARNLPAIALAGIVAFSVYNVALAHEQRTVPAGTSSLLVTTIPALTALWAAVAARAAGCPGLARHGPEPGRDR